MERRPDVVVVGEMGREVCADEGGGRKGGERSRRGGRMGGGGGEGEEEREGGGEGREGEGECRCLPSTGAYYSK